MGKASKIIAKGRNPKAFNEETMAKLRKANPIQRPQVQGTTYRPLRIETNAKATSTPIKKETYSTKLHVTPEQKLRASRAKPQPKPHGELHIIHTVICNKPTQAWTAKQRRAWRKHNKSNPNHTIHF